MRFIEENLKKFKITKRGNFLYIKRKITYYYCYACVVCGYPYLSANKNSKYCTMRCATTGENNHMFGKTGKLNPMFGVCRIGELSSNWKNGVAARNIPLYDTYAHQLEPIEKCIHDPEDQKILNVFCSYSGCKKQYRPTRLEVIHRISGMNKNDVNKFYCSDNCKQICPLFHQSAQQLMERDAENAGRTTKLNQKHIRVYQTTNKKRRYKENGGICDWCEIKVTLKSSILHHEVPVSSNFLMVDDPDNHWLLCKACNKKAHQLVSCNYYELRLRRVCSK
jgi:hypothetical protein